MNRDFLTKSFYHHSETRNKLTDENRQMRITDAKQLEALEYDMSDALKSLNIRKPYWCKDKNE